jgi:serine/threonine protein kinase
MRASRHPLLDVEEIKETPEVFLNAVGKVFTVFDEQTQDSGNISYGVSIGDGRYFIKSAGRPGDTVPFLSHSERVALLRNAVRLSRGCCHPALVRLYNVIESPDSPPLVYEWVSGELLGARRAARDDPRSAFQRFRSLPVEEILRVLDVVYDLHHTLAQLGWIAVDFYDGCLIYDFTRQQLSVVDLDNYHEGPLVNEMGRMFGSSRFMSPEEFQLGARIDERSNVFTMGRTMAVFLSDGTLERVPFRASNAL